MRFGRALATGVFVAGVSVIAFGQSPLPPVQAQAITASVGAAKRRPTNTSQMKSGPGRIRWSLGRGGSSMSPARGSL